MSPELRTSLNGWLKPLLTLVPVILAGAIAYGVIRADVNHVQSELEKKASRETVAAQYDGIMRNLLVLTEEVRELRREIRQ